MCEGTARACVALEHNRDMVVTAVIHGLQPRVVGEFHNTSFESSVRGLNHDSEADLKDARDNRAQRPLLG
jgi:hypothetical protein